MQKHKNRRHPYLACFSPPVMLGTFLVETLLAIFVAIRFMPKLFQSLVCVLLLCLGLFQLAEYQVCVGPGAWAPTWGRIGLVAITVLPSIGMHLIGTVTRKSVLIPIGYAIAAAYTLTFLLVPDATGAPECQGNYVILQIRGGFFGVLYELYYAIFVGLAILELVLRLTRREPPPGLGFSRRLIGFTLAGYLSFTLPMAITGTFSPELRRATPSIMCGFAVCLALILAVYVSPVYDREAKSMANPTPV